MYIGKNVNILNLKKGSVVIEKLNIARIPDTIPKKQVITIPYNTLWFSHNWERKYWFSYSRIWTYGKFEGSPAEWKSKQTPDNIISIKNGTVKTKKVVRNTTVNFAYQ